MWYREKDIWRPSQRHQYRTSVCFISVHMSHSVRVKLLNRGIQREHSSKPLKHSIVKRILVFKRQI